MAWIGWAAVILAAAGIACLFGGVIDTNAEEKMSGLQLIALGAGLIVASLIPAALWLALWKLTEM